MILKKCRLCSSKKLFKFLDLGSHPPSDQFKKKIELNNPTTYYPLQVFSCKSCGFKQLNYVVEPKILYQQNYPYESSLTNQVKKHFAEFALSTIQEYNLKVITNAGGVNPVSCSDELLKILGEFLGKLDIAFKEFDYPVLKRDWVWDIRNIAFLKKHVAYLEDQADQAIVSHIISNYELNINPIEKHLRRQYIHNDGNDHNVLLNEKGHIAGIIDFGDMAHTFLACELAVAISYLILEDENPREKIKAVVDGYQIILPLLAEEIDSLIYLICMRACLTVVTANYRKKLFPDNKYISVTEPQSWNFLRNLADMDLRKFKIY